MSQTLKINTISCTAIYMWLSSHAVCHLKDTLLKADIIFDLGFEIHSFVFSVHFNSILSVKL